MSTTTIKTTALQVPTQVNRPQQLPDFGILFTCIGRRVSLLKSFRKAASSLHLNIEFIGTDTKIISPALQLCDRAFLVSPTTDSRYIQQILNVVKNNHIKLLIPTVDLDLKLLAANKPKFTKLGCRVLVSDYAIINVCQDKRKTYRFLKNNNFDTPICVSINSALSKTGQAKKLSYPCFLKPWDGYASRGNAIVHNRAELSFYAKRIPNPICQEYIKGIEYTCDVYVDFSMQVRCVVPRKRIEVRAGEVSKGQTVKDLRIIDEASRLVTLLGAGPGVVTIQLFLTDDNLIKFIEINPRFGGGAPLSIKAGANFPKWILSELTGKPLKISTNCFKNGLTMLRYDAEVWL